MRVNQRRLTCVIRHIRQQRPRRISPQRLEPALRIGEPDLQGGPEQQVVPARKPGPLQPGVTTLRNHWSPCARYPIMAAGPSGISFPLSCPPARSTTRPTRLAATVGRPRPGPVERSRGLQPRSWMVVYTRVYTTIHDLEILPKPRLDLGYWTDNSKNASGDGGLGVYTGEYRRYRHPISTHVCITKDNSKKSDRRRQPICLAPTCANPHHPPKQSISSGGSRRTTSRTPRTRRSPGVTDSPKRR